MKKYKNSKGMPTCKGHTIEENNKSKLAVRGEFWSINDKRTRGHKSFIVNGNKNRDFILHLPITHSSKTRNIKNKRLIENPEPNRNDDCYIISKVQKSHENSLGKKHFNMKIKNITDKSVVRHIIKFNKKR